MDRPDILWLDGEIKIDGTDAGTLSAADGPVELDITPQEVSASGQRAVDTHTDQIKTDVKVTITGVFWDMGILNKLQGLTKAAGTLDDGLSASMNYSLTGTAKAQQRPYVELLITGKKNGTSNPNNGGAPYRVQIWLGRAKLSGALQLIEQKNDHTKAKLTLKGHALTDKNATFLQIRDEELQS